MTSDYKIILRRLHTVITGKIILKRKIPRNILRQLYVYMYLNEANFSTLNANREYVNMTVDLIFNSRQFPESVSSNTSLTLSNRDEMLLQVEVTISAEVQIADRNR